MIAPSDFLANLKSQIDESGFVSYFESTSKASSEGLALHQAIRKVLNLKPDDSIYMYWQWRELKIAFDAMWLEMDRAASEKESRITSVIAMSSKPDVKGEDMISIITSINPEKLLSFPRAIRRPTKSESQVRFIGKRLGAILMTIGIAADLTESGYGDLLSTLSNSGETEIDLLDHLDQIIIRESTDLNSIKPPQHAVILRALGRAFEKINEIRSKENVSELNFLEFLRETEESANWAGLSDKDVLRRLLAISPDETDAGKKANEKFLTN